MYIKCLTGSSLLNHIAYQLRRARSPSMGRRSRRPTFFATLEQLEDRALLCAGDDLGNSGLGLAESAESWNNNSVEAVTSIYSLDSASISMAAGEASAIASPQYTVKQPPRLQLGNAKLYGFPGGDEDQVEVLWQTIPAGSGTEDSFSVQYRQVGQASWTNAGAIAVINAGVEGRIIHSSLIGGLTYDSIYEYRVQHLRAGNPLTTYQAAFHTRLPPNSNTPFTFAAYGDSANLSTIKNFRSVQSRINQINPSFSILAGDNVYPDGSHPQSDVRFDPAINPEAVKWIASHIDYPSIGNHEINGGSLGKPYEEMFSVPIPIKNQSSSVQPPTSERPEHNYSFDYGNVHFLTFDTNSKGSSGRLNNLLTWAEQDLRASTAQWKIVFGHHPVAGAPDKPEAPQDNYYSQAVPRLRAAGADLFLVGHSHMYGRTYPLLGQTNGQATYVLDPDNNYAKGAGLIQLISGVGGSSLRGGSFSQFPYVAAGFSTETNPAVQYGFTQFDVTKSQLTIRYIAASNGQVFDTFTISEVSNPVSNAAPVANSQSVTTNEDTTRPITLTGSDPNGDPPRYILTSSPSHGKLSGTTPNLSYKPDANFNGSDSFRFKINDGFVDSVTATVSITVKAINDPPVAESLAITTTKDTAVSVTLNGSDADADVVTYSVKISPTSGTLTGTAPNLTYNPSSGFTGTDTFTYQVNDGKSSSNTATVTITVTASNTAVTLSFQNGVFPSVGYLGTEDTKIRGDLPTRVLGTSKTLEIDGNPDMATLLKWNIEQIPAGSTIQAASITINVTDTSTHVFNLYQVLQPWKESSASYNVYDTGKVWEIAGALGIKDRGDKILGTVTAPTLGKLTINLNSSGIAAVQSWRDNSSTNQGLIFQNYANGATNDLNFTSSEGSTAELRPKLTISYIAPTKSLSVAAVRSSHELTNPDNPYDVNRDTMVTPADPLVIFNLLNQNNGLGQGEAGQTGDRSDFYPDVSGDAAITPIDALLVINYLNQLSIGLAEAEAFDSSEELSTTVGNISLWPGMGAVLVTGAFSDDGLDNVRLSPIRLRDTMDAVSQVRNSEATANVRHVPEQDVELYSEFHRNAIASVDLDALVDELAEEAASLSQAFQGNS